MELGHSWVICLLTILSVSALNVTFEPGEMEKFRTGETRNLLVRVQEVESNLVSIGVTCEDKFICRVVNHPAEIERNSEQGVEFNVTIRAEFLGLTNLTVSINGQNYTYPLRLLRSKQGHITSNIFAGFIGVFIVVVTFMMGTQLKIAQIKGILKKPVGPIIGFICQFGLMPLIGYCVATYGLASSDRSTQLALFAVATCPGGGKSSFWTIIFGGNLDLSISMTFFQTIAALFMMPLWLKTLGLSFMDESRITIPFDRILKSLVAIVIPTTIGMVFTHFRPQYVDLIQKWIKRVSWASMIVLSVFAVYTNFYMIWLVNWTIFICACALPWMGYLLALGLALICRQDFKNSITIAIETGIQNVGIAMVLIYMCLPEPESDISVTVVFVMAIMTDKPLVVIWLCSCLYKKMFKKDTVTQKKGSDEEESGVEMKMKIDSNENSIVAV